VSLLGDVVGDNTFTVGSGTLSVHNTLGDTLTGEVSQLVNQVEVGDDNWALGTSGHRVLVVVNWVASGGRNDSLLH
jgi:hypothetical protein